MSSRDGGIGYRRTDLIQLDQEVLGAQFAEEGFGGFAVGAVGFGEDGYIAPMSVFRSLSSL